MSFLHDTQSNQSLSLELPCIFLSFRVKAIYIVKYSFRVDSKFREKNQWNILFCSYSIV